MADIFDLQRHLFRIIFDKLCVSTYIEREVGVMVKHGGLLNCRSVGPELESRWKRFLFNAVLLCFGWHLLPYIQSPKKTPLYK